MSLFERWEQMQSWVRNAKTIRDHPDQVLLNQGQKHWDQQSKRLNEHLGQGRLFDRASSDQPMLSDRNPSVSKSFPEETQIGEYQLQRCIEDSLYEAVNRNQEQVWLKHYHLSERDFKLEQVKQRQAAFEQLVRWNLKIGHGPDFRLLKLLGVFSEERSTYLVMQPLTQALSLRKYLATWGTMRASEVREVLRQVLETLNYLQSNYRVRLGDTFDRELPHGNLSLDSLWIKFAGTNAIAKERRFFIYVTDLRLWEQIISKSPLAKSVTELGSISKDLHALGAIGFQLLSGQEDLSTLNDEQAWQNIHDKELKLFIKRLLNAENQPWTAQAALQKLLAFPETSVTQPQTVQPEEPIQDTSSSTSGCFVLLAGLAGIILLSWLSLSALLNWNHSSPQSNSAQRPESAIPEPDRSNFPTGVSYAIEQGSAWKQILEAPLIYPKRPQATNLLKELIPAASTKSRAAILEAVKNGEVDIAFVELDPPITDLKTIPIARDALVIFVAFSDGNYEGNVSVKLDDQNKTIKLEEIKQAFTSRSIRNLPTKAFPADESSVREMFERKVLGRISKKNEQDEQNIEAPKPKKTNLYNSILDSFEADPTTIAIGYDRLSNMYGQCSVYPLNVEGEQVLKRNNKPIDRYTDLCGDKQSYFPDFSENYKLSYNLGIVYKTHQTEAEKLADTLKNQFHDTLKQLGVIPIGGINDHSSALGSSKTDSR